MEEQPSDDSPEYWEEPTRCPVCGGWLTWRRRVPHYETGIDLVYADVRRRRFALSLYGFREV